MATGASFNMATRRSGAKSQASSKGSVLDRAITFFKKLDRRTLAALVGLLVMIGLTGFGLMEKNRRAHVELYPLRLSEHEVEEISQALTSKHFSHTVSPAVDQVFVESGQRTEALNYLMQMGLPRKGPKLETDQGYVPRTGDQQTAILKENLEAQLCFTIRELESVADARVRLAVPQRTYFQDDNKAVKAAVFLKMAPGHELDWRTAAGVISLVSHSVPELTEDNVMLLDHLGMEMTTSQKPESLEQEVEREKELHLQEKLQTALARLYGPDRVHTVVDLSLDFSEEESRAYTPGSSVDNGMVKDSMQSVHEILGGNPANQERTYDQRKEAVNYKYAENYHVKLRKRAKIDRITATVLVDGAAESEVETIKNIVKGGIGIDETDRQDAVYVSVLPWNRRILGVWDREPTLIPNPEQKGPLSPVELAAMAGLTVLGLAVVGALVARHHRPSLGLDQGSKGLSGAAPTGIVDGLHSKQGHETVLTETATHGSRIEALESLVGSQPTKVAKILRTTWLGGP